MLLTSRSLKTFDTVYSPLHHFLIIYLILSHWTNFTEIIIKAANARREVLMIPYVMELVEKMRTQTHNGCGDLHDSDSIDIDIASEYFGDQ